MAAIDSDTIQEATVRATKILDADCKKADISNVIDTHERLSLAERAKLKKHVI